MSKPERKYTVSSCYISWQIVCIGDLRRSQLFSTYEYLPCYITVWKYLLITFIDKNQCTQSKKSCFGYKSKCWNVNYTRNFNTEVYNILEHKVIKWVVWNITM